MEFYHFSLYDVSCSGQADIFLHPLVCFSKEGLRKTAIEPGTSRRHPPLCCYCPISCNMCISFKISFFVYCVILNYSTFLLVSFLNLLQSNRPLILKIYPDIRDCFGGVIHEHRYFTVPVYTAAAVLTNRACRPACRTSYSVSVRNTELPMSSLQSVGLSVCQRSNCNKPHKISKLLIMTLPQSVRPLSCMFLGPDC